MAGLHCNFYHHEIGSPDDTMYGTFFIANCLEKDYHVKAAPPPPRRMHVYAVSTVKYPFLKSFFFLLFKSIHVKHDKEIIKLVISQKASNCEIVGNITTYFVDRGHDMHYMTT